MRAISLAAIGTFTFAVAGVLPAHGQVVTLNPSQDNTLYEQNDPVSGVPAPTSNGVGPHLYIGKTFGDLLRRGLVQFDIAGNVPAGVQIDSAELSFVVTKARSPFDQPVTIHRVTTAWGEGTSDAGDPGGQGAPATTGDATWVYAFFASDLWASPGGDYVAAASGTGMAGMVNSDVIISSTPEMVADVQSWLDAPATNYGWCVLGNEASSGDAKRLGSRENSNPAMRPMVTISYSMPAVLGDMNCDGAVSVGDIGGFVLALTDPAGYAAQFPDCDIDNADINGDNTISVSDIGPFVALLTG